MRLILFFCLLFPCIGYAQDTTTCWSLGMFGRVEWNNRFMSSTDELSEYKSEFDSLEKARIGYSFGAIISKNLTNRISLHSGLNFTEKGYQIDTLEELSITKIQSHFKYLELPLRVGFRFCESKKVQLFSSVGLSVQYLLSHTVDYRLLTVAETYQYKDDQVLNTFGMGMIASIGLEKSIQSKYLFRAECAANQGILAISNSPLKRYLHSVGIGISLERKF